MSEIQQPLQHTPAVVPASEHNAAVTSATDASADPIRSQETSELSPESRPELGQSGIPDGTTAAALTAPNVTNMPKEDKVGKGEVMVESHPINEGVLNYKGPGLKCVLPSCLSIMYGANRKLSCLGASSSPRSTSGSATPRWNTSSSLHTSATKSQRTSPTPMPRTHNRQGRVYFSSPSVPRTRTILKVSSTWYGIMTSHRSVIHADIQPL